MPQPAIAEALASRLEAIASRLEAIALRLETLHGHASFCLYGQTQHDKNGAEGAVSKDGRLTRRKGEKQWPLLLLAMASTLVAFLFLVRPGAPSSVLVTTSKALVTRSDALCF